MSIIAIAWAFKVEGLSSPAKFVLVKLADNANDDGTCWPSVDHLAKHTALSRRSVQEQLAKLEQAGLVKIERRKTEGVNLPNMYRLNIEAHSLVANKAHYQRTRSMGVANQVQEGGAYGSGGVANQVHPNRQSKPSIEPSLNQTSVEPLSRSPLVSFPTINGSEFGVSEEMASEYIKAYPAVDVLQAMNEMRAWCLSNPTQRKTERGMPRFINTWLSKAQNRSGMNGHGRSRPTAYDNFFEGALLAAEAKDRAAS